MQVQTLLREDLVSQAPIISVTHRRANLALSPGAGPFGGMGRLPQGVNEYLFSENWGVVVSKGETFHCGLVFVLIVLRTLNVRFALLTNFDAQGTV